MMAFLKFIVVLLVMINTSYSLQLNLSQFLWNDSLDLANEALKTSFIQGIKNGTLNPEKYGSYMVQDVVYTLSEAENLALVLWKANGSVKTLLQHKVFSYKEYALSMMKTWNVHDKNAVELGTGAKNYMIHLRNIADTYDAVYYLIAMTPCEQLWYWLGNQLKPYKRNGNIYNFWIDENCDTSGGKSLHEVIDQNQANVNWTEALKIFRKSMQAEVDFFESAVIP